MKTTKYHTVGLKSNIKMVEWGKIDTLAHKYMIAHLPAMVTEL